MLFRVLLSFVIAVFMLGCSATSKNENVKLDVGVLMPTKSVQRWNQDGTNIKNLLEAEGYSVDLQYASNEVATQVSQIETMLSNDVKILVIAPVDSEAHLLSNILDRAKLLGVHVVSYDIFTRNTDSVSYYATFDSYSVGTVQAKYIVDKLGLADGAGPFNIELLTGDLSYNNTPLFFNGAMDILNPYIDNGQLVVKSGKRSIEDASITLWASDTAQAHLKDIIDRTYSNNDEKIDAVLCSNDTIALGVVRALIEAKYSVDDMPIITGQDCDILNVKKIIGGLQSMSVFKDTRELAAITAAIVCDILKGEEPNINARLVYNNNGTKDVPSYVLEPFTIDVSNYEELLIDSGYYRHEDLK